MMHQHQTMDVQGVQTIDYEEFLAATVHASKITSDENLFFAFAEVDRDGDGCVRGAAAVKNACDFAVVGSFPLLSFGGGAADESLLPTRIGGLPLTELWRRDLCAGGVLCCG